MRPDYVIQVREATLSEIDEPMMKCSLLSFHNLRLPLPTRIQNQPLKIALERATNSIIVVCFCVIYPVARPVIR